MAKESDGALCIFLDEFKGHDDEPLPLIVRKSDGGYLYATTDLAAIKRRGQELGADRILYLTDSRQALHFAQVFAVARRASFVDETTSLEHIVFGTMLRKDGRPFKTREGGTVKLMDLLGEAEQRAADVVRQKNPDLSAERAGEIARVVGIGAVKYADLSMDRTSDYKFSWSKMLALQGNTAPYMQYAYARVRSIFRRGAAGEEDLTCRPITLAEPAERELAKHIARLEETLAAVAAECKPNILTAHLFDLASAFSVFYESCPVLKADAHVRDSRLRLCDLTARVIKCGLGLLGIDVVEQM
jgi:arginyl-tRNA synthetase